MKYKYLGTVLAAIGLLACAVTAQQTIANGVTYSQNFDSFGTVNVSFTDNTTITGIYTFRSAGNTNPKTLTASAGTSGTSQFYSFGNAANTNRALGWVNANGVTSYAGLRLQNVGSNAITSLQIQFAGEQWRDGNGSAETMPFAYQTGATVISLTTGTWTAVPALLFTSPNAPGGSNAWNGDLAANRTAFNQTLAINSPGGKGYTLVVA